MKILVIRFRQMGDAILSTSLLNTLRLSFPDAEIHFVMNKRIAPLFEGHQSIDKVITFTDEERHAPLIYLKKVWHIVHDTHYDAIIDLRSTVNTMIFALLSPTTRFRIGIKKNYTILAFNYRRQGCGISNNMVVHNSHMAEPLEKIAPIKYTTSFTLHITAEERIKYKDYLVSMGLNLDKPILLVNPTAKDSFKAWPEDNMVRVLDSFLKNHPDIQMVLNYAPGREEENARNIYQKLGSPKQIFIDVKARSMRELAALSSYITLFFGNEGGGRHIAHAMGTPSLVICSPGCPAKVWIPKNDIPAETIETTNIMSEEQLSTMTYEEQYNVITPEYVSQKLEAFYKSLNR